MWRRYLRFFRPDVERDIDDELRFHFESRTAELMARGMAAAEARRLVIEEFGPEDATRRRLREIGRRRERQRVRFAWWDAAVADLRFGARMLARTPFVTAVAVISLALGIGANAATFSLFDELLLQPLPVPEPHRLVNLGAPGPKPGRDNWTQAGNSDALFSHPMFRDLARAQKVFTDIAAHRLFLANLAYRDRAQFGDAMLVSGAYFRALGVRPALGRLLSPADDEAIGGHPVAVLGYGYWSSSLGADSAVIGTTITVNGQALSVVGVAARGFDGTTLGSRPRVYLPLMMAATLDPGFGPAAGFADRRSYLLYLFARLRPGVSADQARRAMNSVYVPIVSDIEAPLQPGLSAPTLARFKARTLTIEDGSRGQSILRGETRRPLVLLFAITALVVVIACANVANLLLARGATRGTEIAVRVSLGAGRQRLITQLLTESCLLAAIAGAASLIVARATLVLIASLVPSGDFSVDPTLSLTLRPSALAFAGILAIGTGLLFGLFPALHSTRPDLITAIRASSGQPSGARSAARFRSSLVTAQIALSMALLIAAGLFIKSLRNVSRVNLGLETDHTITFGVAPQFSGYDAVRTREFFTRLEEALASTPGVASVAASGVQLLSGSTNGGNVRVEGFRRGPDTDANTRMNEVGPGFFRTLGIGLLAGREFTPADRLGSPKVVIVNETFAKKFGLGAAAVGRRMAIDGDGTGESFDMEIVGLVRDSHYSGVKTREPPLVFTPYHQDSSIVGLFVYTRTSLAPEPMLRTVAGVLARIDPGLPLVGLKTMPQQVRENVYLDRMIGVLSAAFAGLATLLAAVGLYGVLAYTVTQRTREIGLRMALGANAGSVRRLVMKQVGRMAAIGAAIGVLAALALGRGAQSLLYGLESNDPAVVIGAICLLGLVAFGAGWIPAWRASRVDPMRALRQD
jgi:predicted permease